MRALTIVASLLAFASPAAAESVTLDVNTGMFFGNVVRGRNPTAFESDSFQMGFSLGGLLAMRLGIVRVGATIEGATSIFGPEFVHAGVVAGPVFQMGLHQRFELYGELGYAWISDIGDDFDQTSTGETESQLPYAGARLGYVHELGSRGRWAAGAWLSYRHNLESSVNDVVTSGIIDGGPETYDVGGSHFTGYVSLIFQAP